MDGPAYITCDAQDNVYVSCFRSHNLAVFTKDGGFCRIIQCVEDPFINPVGIAVAEDGSITVAGQSDVKVSTLSEYGADIQCRSFLAQAHCYKSMGL